MANKNGGFIGTDGLDAPDPPTAVTPTADVLSVSVAFTAPTDTGTSAITGFVAQVSTDGTDYSAGSNTGTSSPIVVSSLTAGAAATAKVWAINAYGTSAPSDASASFTPTAAIRGLIGGVGNNNSYTNVIEFITVSTTGDSTDFGDRTVSSQRLSSFASSTRGVFNGGQASANLNTIDYVTISTTGNASDFGDTSAASQHGVGLSSNVRGVMALGIITSGSDQAYVDTIDYVTIANTGNASDFGNLTMAKGYLTGCASPTRGLIAGGYSDVHGTQNVIEYITIGSTGNGSDFGDLTSARYAGSSCASNTRGLFAAGYSSARENTIEYVTIASAGNVTDFGDLTSAQERMASVCSNLRAVFAGGLVGPIASMDYVTIASTGNGSDFGDLSAVTHSAAGCSSGHGGIAA